MVLVPTRELALQVHDALEPLGRGLGLRMKVVVGGMSMGKQIEALRRGVDVLIATPGRLGDLIRQGECSLEDIEISVLDEADHMCDLGFFPVVTELLAQTPPGGQRLLFSATLDGDVDKLVRRFLKDPISHSVAPATSPVDTMEHHVLQVTRDDKFDITAEIANREGRTIIFVRTQHGVDRLCKQLARVGVKAGGLHGGKRQNQRTRILAEFREGSVNVLVCTDVAARGIHVDNISLVLHVDPPQDSKSYLHRGGRTARAGEKGTVVTLVLPNERRSTESLTRRAEHPPVPPQGDPRPPEGGGGHRRSHAERRVDPRVGAGRPQAPAPAPRQPQRPLPPSPSRLRRRAPSPASRGRFLRPPGVTRTASRVSAATRASGRSAARAATTAETRSRAASVRTAATAPSARATVPVAVATVTTVPAVVTATTVPPATVTVPVAAVTVTTAGREAAGSVPTTAATATPPTAAAPPRVTATAADTAPTTVPATATVPATSARTTAAPGAAATAAAAPAAASTADPHRP
ncbi:DEAD/DEAH box helicase [Nonomuraea ferruginea]